MSIFSNGTLATDDYSYADAATVPPPPPAMGNSSLEIPDVNCHLDSTT